MKRLETVSALTKTGKHICWLIESLVKEHPETPVWLNSTMVGKTVQVYAFKDSTLRFSEPFGSMEFFLRMDDNGRLSVTDGSKKNSDWISITSGMALCTGIDNPRMLGCLAVLRAYVMEQFMPEGGFYVAKN